VLLLSDITHGSAGYSLKRSLGDTAKVTENTRGEEKSGDWVAINERAMIKLASWLGGKTTGLFFMQSAWQESITKLLTRFLGLKDLGRRLGDTEYFRANLMSKLFHPESRRSTRLFPERGRRYEVARHPQVADGDF
jgi:hypothetical protein